MMTFAEIDWRRQHHHATRIRNLSDIEGNVDLQADFDYPGPYPAPPEPRTALESMAQAWMVLRAIKLDIEPCPACGSARHQLGYFEDGRCTAWCDKCEAWTAAPAKETQ
ncbi:hypothetical protein LCGC14_0259370 [marine sediment metagenome]|uniref:Uncharacterized protein n=1 Tax=marine sediment metagenome TaxID=412755 RepID=A0A0F9UJE1_9ZZZZ